MWTYYNQIASKSSKPWVSSTAEATMKQLNNNTTSNIIIIKRNASWQHRVSKPYNKYEPLLMVNAGDHCDRNISRHMLPLLFMFGWYILVVKASCRNKKMICQQKKKQQNCCWPLHTSNHTSVYKNAEHALGLLILVKFAYEIVI